VSIYNVFSEFKSRIILLVGPILLFASLGVNSAPYIPPIGIPAPEFGINESHMMYENSQYDFGTGMEEPYKDAGSGPYTHYVDGANANAKDTDNPYGSPSTPRKTIPKMLAAGSVVEVHGGPYGSPTYITWQMNGTPTAPVFIRGVSNGNRVQIRGVSGNSPRLQLQFKGEYFIVENIDFFDKVTIAFDPEAKYGTLRNSEVHNPIGSEGALNPTVNAQGTHIVIYGNEIHDNVRSAEKDNHGIQGGAGGYKIWVLGNTIYRNGGNGFQACNKCNTIENPTPRFIYIGGNEFYSDKEVGIALKYAEDVIISENVIHDYSVPSPTSTIAGIIIGADGYPYRVWVLNNEIYSSIRGIRSEEAVDLWMIGNVIYDIDQMAIHIEKTNPNTNIIGNTVVNADLFINQDRWHIPVLNVQNNIVVDMVGARYGNHMNIESPSVYSSSSFNNNLFWKNGNEVLLRLGGGASGSNVAFNLTEDFNTYSFGSNNIIADPLFVDQANNNYQLQSDSPAINSGAINDAYQIFQETYGIDIRQDKSGLARPQQEVLDIGAFEYTDSALEVITRLLASSQVGNTVTYPIVATGGSAPYAWSISEGVLPGGLSLDTLTGIISGTPLASGNYNFTLMVQDSVLASDAQSLSLIVDMKDSGSVLEITTDSLSNSQVGKAAFYPLVVIGGIMPYTWSTSTALPDGLGLDASTGIISGIPTMAGEYSLNVMVQDNVLSSDTQTLSLVVNAKTAVVPLAPSNLNATTVSSNQIDLSWTDNSNNESSFAIEYSIDGGNNFNELLHVAIDATTYSHIGLTAGSTYHYRVFSENGSAFSVYSNLANATTQIIVNNNTPTDIKIDNGDTDSIEENTASGTIISQLSTTDSDASDTHSYALVAGIGDEDNAKFTISDDNLVLSFNPDYEVPIDIGDTANNNSYRIRIQTNDANGV